MVPPPAIAAATGAAGPPDAPPHREPDAPSVELLTPPPDPPAHHVVQREPGDAIGAPRAALDVVLIGVLARLETGHAGDPGAITAALRQSVVLGEAYASAGQSATRLIQAYRGLRERLARLLPANLPADEPWAREWRDRLDRAVDGFLKVALQTFERQRVADWERLAHVDGATRVYNRGYFERRFLDEIRRAERYQRPVTVLVADPAGSPTGSGQADNGQAADSPRERLARLGGRALERVLRDVDLVTRRPGHELVALLPDTTLCGGRVAAERALLMARDEAATFGLDPAALALAIGLATYPDHGNDAWTVLAAADHALYRAQHTGCGVAVA
jgi:GGDEF domain-containing protein